MGEPDNVSGVLARAAARAARLAELDTAQTSIQKLLNIDMPPEMLPWGAVLSHDWVSVWFIKHNGYVCLDLQTNWTRARTISRPYILCLQDGCPDSPSTPSLLLRLKDMSTSELDSSKPSKGKAPGAVASPTESTRSSTGSSFSGDRAPSPGSVDGFVYNGICLYWIDL